MRDFFLILWLFQKTWTLIRSQQEIYDYFWQFLSRYLFGTVSFDNGFSFLTLVILISQELLMLIMVIHDDIALLTQIHFVIIFITSKCWWVGLSAKKNGLLVTKKPLLNMILIVWRTNYSLSLHPRSCSTLGRLQRYSYRSRVIVTYLWYVPLM